MTSYLIYDVEIVNAIPTEKEAPISGINYCGGWRDFQGMGVSVIGYQIDDLPPSYTLSVKEFSQILESHQDRVIVGFNSISFDDRLLAANGCEIRTELDLLEQCRIAAGFEADYKSVPMGYSYALGKIAQANGMTKTGTGENAAILWQEGQRQSAIDYCLNDVALTRSILDLGLAGKLVDPNTGELLKIEIMPF